MTGRRSLFVGPIPRRTTPFDESTRSGTNGRIEPLSWRVRRLRRSRSLSSGPTEGTVQAGGRTLEAGATPARCRRRPGESGTDSSLPFPVVRRSWLNGDPFDPIDGSRIDPLSARRNTREPRRSRRDPVSSHLSMRTGSIGRRALSRRRIPPVADFTGRRSDSTSVRWSRPTAS